MSAWLFVFLAAALHFTLGGVAWLAILAIWICWGRVYIGVHYPSDIAGGFAIAALLAVLANSVQ